MSVNSPMNLNTLLESLESSSGIEKSASAVKITPDVSDQLSSILGSKNTEDMTKLAYASGAELAKELLANMQKSANVIIQNDNATEVVDAAKVVPTSEGTVESTLVKTVEQGLDRGATSDDVVDAVMDDETGTEKVAELKFLNKKAEEMKANKILAKSILEKIAEAPMSTDGTPAGAIAVADAPNVIQMNDAANIADDNAKVLPNPGTEGTITNIFEQIVARAKAQGAGSDDLVNGTNAEQRDEPEVEKAAAVSALVEEGMDFNTAVDLVKQAEYELALDKIEIEKKAAFAALAEQGVDFDTAVELIKQAEEDLLKEAFSVNSAKEIAKTVGKSIRGDAKVLPKQLKSLARGTDLMGKTTNRKVMAKAIGSNKAVHIGAGSLAAGATAAALSHEKKAAFDELLSMGIDFDDAIILVKQAEEELYGN